MLYDGKAVPDINRVVLQLLKVEVLKIYERTPHGTRRYRRTESRPPPPCGGRGTIRYLKSVGPRAEVAYPPFGEGR